MLVSISLSLGRTGKISSIQRYMDSFTIVSVRPVRFTIGKFVNPSPSVKRTVDGGQFVLPGSVVTLNWNYECDRY